MFFVYQKIIGNHVVFWDTPKTRNKCCGSPKRARKKVLSGSGWLTYVRIYTTPSMRDDHDPLSFFLATIQDFI